MTLSQTATKLSFEQLEPWIQQWVEDLAPQQLILLNGPLGAGKTALVKKTLQVLGHDEASSPTYSMIHRYVTPKVPLVFHVDLYRIEDADDLESIGFWDLFENDKALIFVEWAERISLESWPLHWPRLDINISKSDDLMSRDYRLLSSNSFKGKV